MSHLEILLALSFAELLEAVVRSGAGALEEELGQVERLEQAGMMELIQELEQAGKLEVVEEQDSHWMTK